MSDDLTPQSERLLHHDALRAAVDMADLAHDVAVPRDWWLRAKAMDHVLRWRASIPGYMAEPTPSETREALQAAMAWIEKGEFPA